MRSLLSCLRVCMRACFHGTVVSSHWQLKHNPYHIAMPLPLQAAEIYMHLAWLLRSMPPGTPILKRRITHALACTLQLQTQTKTPKPCRRYRQATCTLRTARYVLDWVVALAKALRTESEEEGTEKLLRLCQLAATRARRESMRRPLRARASKK